MSTYAADGFIEVTEAEIAQRLIYGTAPHSLRQDPARVVLDDAGLVSVSIATRVVRAPRRVVGGSVVGRKWSKSTPDCDRNVIAEDGDYVLVTVSPSYSLFALMATSNCEHANRLGMAELATVVWCIANAPFPLGRGVELYAEALRRVELAFLRRAEASLAGTVYDPPATTLDGWLLGFSGTTVGQLRRWLVDRAGSGCNAPTDSYLRIAAWWATHPGAELSDVPVEISY